VPVDRAALDAARQRQVALAGLLIFILAFAAFALERIFPPAPYGLADDWRVFYAAAQVVQHGGNPYDAATMHAAEQAAQHYTSVQPSLDDFTDLPTVAVLLRIVTWLPYWLSFAVFTVLGVAAAAAALAAWMRRLGWRTRGLWLAGALCSWPMLLGLFSGQFDALLLAGLVAALLLLQSDRPVPAALCMAVVLLKPHLLWPAPLLLWVAWLPHAHNARRFGITTLLVLVTGAVAGFLLVPDAWAFFGHAFGFGSRIGAVQPDLSGLPGLVAALPGHSAIGVVAAFAGVLGVGALAYGSARSPLLARLTPRERAVLPLAGIGVWLACTPYAHPNDDVLLFPLLAVLVGAEGLRTDRRMIELGVVGCLALIAAFLSSLWLGYAVLLGAGAWLVFKRGLFTADHRSTLALTAIVLLPVVWPFHVLSVSLTPVAVVLTAAAGVERLALQRARASAPRLRGDVRERAPTGAIARA
jgi:hypothetical protein